MMAFEFWIDRGGTFTDIVAKRPDGSTVTHKLLSENPEQYPDAAIQGIRNILQLDVSEPIPSGLVSSVKMGTTVATNALLERNGEPTVLVTNRGLRDVLRIGYQNRPRLFDLKIELPSQLYDEVIEVSARTDAHGTELAPLDAASTKELLQHVYDKGIRACAVVLIHGYRYTSHEQAIAAIAAEVGFRQISVSHAVSPLMKMVGRGDTTVVDAYLSGLLRRYVNQVSAELADTRLMFMQSNGGLTDAKLFQGKDSILSGPAGGIVGAVRTSEMAGFNRIIGFDMGGTSTDVSHYAGEFERAFDTQVAGVRMRVPIMRIHTVAAGGGSICQFDGARFRVGPDSAGANPGPACYRRDGPLTVTDCNVMLGKLRPEYFPSVFGPLADQPLDTAIVQEKFAALARSVSDLTGQEHTPEALAQGFIKIAVENMANAIKKISVQRGYDVTNYTLCCFGGAGGQHACLVADALGMQQIVIHPYAGVLSAYGMGLADVRALREQSVETQLDKTAVAELETQFASLEKSVYEELKMQQLDHSSISIHRRAHVKYDGTDSAIEVAFGDEATIRSAFECAYRDRYGFIMSEKALLIEAIAIEGIGHSERIDEETIEPCLSPLPDPLSSVAMRCNQEDLQSPVFARSALGVGHQVAGPAMIVEETGTTIIEPGWRAVVNSQSHLVLNRVEELQREHAIGTAADPVMLEIFNNLFMSIAEQMGAALENTAYSVNIKERLDFSCALFDTSGNLIANAPHMPVHLGSMSESVREVIRNSGDNLQPGDIFALNDPYHGGTHLPDITVVTPVFDRANTSLLFFVASRGHHADVGGMTPGSMPPDSHHIDEEGLLINHFQLVKGGTFLEQETRALFGSGTWPARNPVQNIADLKAQIAANEKGASELHAMVDHYGLEVVSAYMQHVQDNAEEAVRTVLHHLSDGQFTYAMDDGAQISVAITVDRKQRSAVVDFAGTSPQQASNFNAPSAVCRAAVLYVFRTLVDDEIPMNEGCLKPIELRIPQGSMLSPSYPAAVVAGNVETSQCITDALYGALQVVAAAQGTMNNLTFGNDRYQYYETICGGSGAGPGFDGTSAVHTHMTNSRLTDPEVLEWRFPVILREFSIRQGSGGTGKFVGGNGTTREIEFCEPMTAAILSGHRLVPPFGMAGGADASVGRNFVRRADASIEEFGATAKTQMQVGDRFVIETPGGGGYGTPDD